MISLVRVDNRLIHGQVVEAWLPHLKVSRVVVADEEASQSPLVRSAMALAVHHAIDVQIQPLQVVDFRALSQDAVSTLVLIREVEGVVEARDRGLPVARLNVGNVHFAEGRRKVSPSVFLSQRELDQLRMLSESGAEVEARAVPGERPIRLAELEERFGKGA